MALFILGPDPAGNCCDCTARANPCDNCGELECSLECVSNTTACCTQIIPNCLGPGISCTTVNAEFPCVGPGTGLTIITAEVRGLASGLVIGRTYKLTIHLCRVDDCAGVTSDIEFDFEASASTEITDYVSIPNPSGLDQPGWTASSCEICQTVSLGGGLYMSRITSKQTWYGDPNSPAKPGWNKEKSLFEPNLPSNWQMAKNLVQAGVDVIKNGMEKRSSAEIEDVLKICVACPFFIANEWGGRCGKCGCRLGTSKDGSLRFGKPIMRAWHCPIGKW